MTSCVEVRRRFSRCSWWNENSVRSHRFSATAATETKTDPFRNCRNNSWWETKSNCHKNVTFVRNRFFSPSSAFFQLIDQNRFFVVVLERSNHLQSFLFLLPQWNIFDKKRKKEDGRRLLLLLFVRRRNHISKSKSAINISNSVRQQQHKRMHSQLKPEMNKKL